MQYTNFVIIGIATNTLDATVRTKPDKGPQKSLTMTKIQLVGNANGKLFLALRNYDPETPNIIGMYFNGEQVPIRKNELYMGTNTADQSEGRYKAYAFDIPMRFIEEPFPKTFDIQFILGHMDNDSFVEESTSDIFNLIITG